MTLQVIGALCIVIALIGGGLKFNGVEIPRLSRRRIAALIAVGVALIGLSLLANEKTAPDGPGQVPTPHSVGEPAR